MLPVLLSPREAPCSTAGALWRRISIAALCPSDGDCASTLLLFILVVGLLLVVFAAFSCDLPLPREIAAPLVLVAFANAAIGD